MTAGAGAAWDESKHPRVPSGPGGGRFALAGSAGGNVDQIATANMTSVKADKSVYKQPSVAAMMGEGEKDPKNAKLYDENFKSDIALFHNANFYPNFRESELKGTVKEQADAIVKNMTSNLVFLYNHATEEVRAGGLLWYEGANKMAAALAEKYSLPLAAVVGTIAKLSPNKNWDQNVELAHRILEIYSTKQDYKYDEEMTAQAPTIWSVKNIGNKEPTEETKNSQTYKDKVALYQSYQDGIRDKTLGELKGEPVLQAAWIKTYDIAHNPQNYRQFLPSGQLGDLVRNTPRKAGEPGAPSKLVWQSTPLLADAIKALESKGNRDTLSDLMGEGHKVRSFFNNILDPHSPNHDVTVDTHAVGAALLSAIGASSVPVNHNFGLTPEKKDQPKGWTSASGSAITGLSGTYGLYADAYRAAAKQLGVEPLQVQAVVWEAKRDVLATGRATLGAPSDKAVAEIGQTWRDYHDEKISQAQAQERVWKIANEDVSAKAQERTNKLNKPGRVKKQAELKL